MEDQEQGIHLDKVEKKLNIYGFKDGLDQLPDGEYLAPLPFTSSEKHFAFKLKEKLKYPFIHSRGFGPYFSKNDGSWPCSSSPGSTLKNALATGNVEILTNHVVE